MKRMKNMEDNLTRGEKKILLQFERFIETNTFRQEVERIRSLLKLPVNGIEPTEKDLKNLSNRFRIPDNFPIKKLNNNEHPIRILNVEIRKIINSLPIDSIYFSSLVRYYILFNKFFYDELKNFESRFHSENVCELEDAQEGLPDGDPYFNIRAYLEMMETKLGRYPIALRIHPEASQRDIVEYIKKHWPEIKFYQDRHVDKNKKASFKNSKTKENPWKKERRDFIYKNRHLPLKEIMHLVTVKFGSARNIDCGHIGKIISLENKRRKA